MNAIGVASSGVGGVNASGCGGKTGDDVGNEKALWVEENTWFFPVRIFPVSKLKREENQPMVSVVVVVRIKVPPACLPCYVIYCYKVTLLHTNYTHNDNIKVR